MKVLLPERCQHCGRKLPQKSDRVTTEGEPRRHQVTEIPEINPHTTEYPCPQVVCEHGQKTTQEPLPEEVRGNFGPLDGADRLLDGGLSGAATAGGNDAGRCWAWKSVWGALRKLGRKSARRSRSPVSNGRSSCRAKQCGTW